MSRMLIRRRLMIAGVVAVGGVVAIAAGEATRPARAGGIGGRHVDAAQIVPLDQIAPERRDAVIEVIQEHTFHRQGEADTFLCPTSLYLSLLNEPHLTVALWKDLGDSPVQLQKVATDQYSGTDGSGSTATWEFVLRNPRLHVLMGYFNFVSPHGNVKLDARIVLVVHTSYFRDSNKDPVVQHQVDVFVKVDSRGWKAMARTARAIIEPILEEQVKEAGLFISLMSRLVLTYPNWAAQVVSSQPHIDAATRQKFCTIVAQTRRPDASNGRPVAMTKQAAPDSRRR